jgi:hypothetical protein
MKAAALRNAVGADSRFGPSTRDRMVAETHEIAARGPGDVDLGQVLGVTLTVVALSAIALTGAGLVVEGGGAFITAAAAEATLAGAAEAACTAACPGAAIFAADIAGGFGGPGAGRGGSAITTVERAEAAVAEGDPLLAFAEANRDGTSRFASEYTSPSGQRYYDVNANREIPANDPLGNLGTHHGGCAEIGCLRQAAMKEGPEAAFGGSMRTIRNRPPNTSIPPGPPNGQGAIAAPCPACQRILAARNIPW